MSHFPALVQACRVDFDFFCSEVVKFPLRPKQREFNDAFETNPRVTFRAGVGIGKSTVAALAIVRGVLCFDNIEISVVGPGEDQVKRGLWKEIENVYSRLPPELKAAMELTKSTLTRKGARAQATLRIANKQNTHSLRGIHAPINWIFVDEALGVDDEVFDVLMNIFSDMHPKMVLISNPTSSTGFFADTHLHPEISKDWVQIHGQASDNPDLTAEGLEALIRAKGGRHSRRARADIFGEFPIDNESGVVPLDCVQDAIDAMDVVPSPSLMRTWGVDPAGEGRDRSALVIRHDNRIIDIRVWKELGSTPTAALADALVDLYNKTPAADRPGMIAVDGVGIGQGVHDQLQRAGLPVRKIAASNKPLKDGYMRRRDELWWQAREWFEEGNVCLPSSLALADELVRELCLPTYEYKNGKVKVEAKADIKKRGRASPDLADAFCLSLAVPSPRRNAFTTGSGSFAFKPRKHLS